MAAKQRSWRQNNVGRALFGAADRLLREKLTYVHACGFDEISVAVVAVFQNLDIDGSRLTQIAERAHLTKQSVLELVNKAESLGFVERKPDPDDRRAKIVIFTPYGIEALDVMRIGVASAEKTLSGQIGRGFLREAKQKLTAYSASADALTPMPEPSRLSAANDLWRVKSAGRIFGDAADRFAFAMLRRVEKRSGQNVPQVLLSLLINLDLDGTRLTDLAARARVTKQAMLELVERAHELGWVSRSPDPTDGRAKIVRFTPRGLRLLSEIEICVKEDQRRMAEALGADFIAELIQKLLSYVASEQALLNDA